MTILKVKNGVSTKTTLNNAYNLLSIYFPGITVEQVRTLLKSGGSVTVNGITVIAKEPK